MAETLISPGVLARENDQTQITSQPVQAGAAIVGPTVKGKPLVPKLVTSYSEYEANFGSTFTSGSNSDQYTFLTSIAAQNYFANGGTSLLVTRVVSGSSTPAISSTISSSATPPSNVFTLETLGTGEILNSTSAEGAANILESGSLDNLRWEIVSPNTSSGTFSLLIRRGNDSRKNKIVLETFTNLSLDPKSSNYIERVIGNQTQTFLGSGTSDPYLQTTGSFPNASRYVRVKEVLFKTPDYLDNNGAAKDQYTSSIPVAASGTFGGATGTLEGVGALGSQLYENIGSTTQGLVAGNYTDAFNLLANKDDYQYNIITAPGLIYADHSSVLNTLIENTENRGDAIVVIDMVRYGSTITTAV